MCLFWRKKLWILMIIAKVRSLFRKNKIYVRNLRILEHDNIFVIYKY